MDEEIKKKLKEFHDYNEEARKHFKAHQLKPGEPLHVHTEVDLMQYSKWRTKANIALNEFHALLVEKHPNQLPYPREQLEREKQELLDKLERTEKWLQTI